jgi:hypothetical protein
MFFFCSQHLAPAGGSWVFGFSAAPFALHFWLSALFAVL